MKSLHLSTMPKILYCNDYSEKVADYFDFWRERVDDYLYDEEEQMYYKPKKIAV